MKKMKKIMAAAIAMMTFSTAAAVTGTVAWFTANNIVSAQGMSIKAEAEEGIVIAQELASYTDASWKTNVNAAHDGSGLAKGFIPTSTVNTSAWYHGNSESADTHEAGTGDNAIKPISVTAADLVTGNGVGTATVNNIAGRNVYLLNHFYIQSTIPTSGIINQDLRIENVTAQDSTQDAKAKELNKSLRVLFKLKDSNEVKVYAPLLEADFTTTSAYSTNAEYVNGDDNTPDVLLDNGTIPAYVANSNASCLDLSVYIYFDGEDTNCKSANIGTFASISVSFKLKNVPHSN